jgi:uncharacterized protein YjiS (DUF1127 family)
MSNRQMHAEPLRLRHHHPLPDQGQTLWSALRAAWVRHRSRQRIAQLDGEMLKDIGVSYSEAEMEANKPFWQS